MLRFFLGRAAALCRQVKAPSQASCACLLLTQAVEKFLRHLVQLLWSRVSILALFGRLRLITLCSERTILLPFLVTSLCCVASKHPSAGLSAGFAVAQVSLVIVELAVVVEICPGCDLRTAFLGWAAQSLVMQFAEKSRSF